MLQTSNVEVGNLSQKYSYDYKTRVKQEISRFDHFLKMSKFNGTYISSNSIGDAYHKNYMDYLEICWSDHLGVVFTPDIIWYTLLCEISEIIKESPEKYRSHFTISKEKQEISVFSDSSTEMPMESLISAMKSYVPSDIDLFIPEFTTSTTSSKHAFQVAFADAASPYYDYSMYCCGIPFVDIRGDKTEYSFIKDRFLKISSLLGLENKWLTKVDKILNDLINNFNSAEFWKNIFKLERCGSGGQVEVEGWYSKLFRKQPKIRYTHNFSTHLASIDYKDRPTNLEYNMKSGIISSIVEDNLLVPQFGNMIFLLTPLN